MSCDAPDIQRLLASFEHRPTDRVPNFEILIEDKHCSRLLGCAVGHTLGSAKGSSPPAGCASASCPEGPV